MTTKTDDPVAAIMRLFSEKGDSEYGGESVNQREHALQAAACALRDGADDPLVVAALLHDLGHMLEDLGQTPTLAGIDDLHQYRILPFLRGVFSDAVLAPIALHVDAKRYLCATDAGYFSTLSADSVRSLQLQGGVFDVEQAAAFIDRPHAVDAVRLRRWDDRAKTAGMTTPDFAHFARYFDQCLVAPGAGRVIQAR